MENEKKRFVEQELNSDDYKKAVNGAKAVKEGGLIGSLVVGTFFHHTEAWAETPQSFVQPNLKYHLFYGLQRCGPFLHNPK